MELHEQFKAEREAQGKKEKQEAGLYARMLQYSRDRYVQAETLLHFQSEKNLQDTLFIQENIVDWLEKAKDGSKQKAVLNEMAGALIRMNAYTITTETAAMQAVATSIRDNEAIIPLEKEIKVRDVTIKEREFEIMKLNSEIKRLHDDINKLNQQISFGS